MKRLAALLLLALFLTGGVSGGSSPKVYQGKNYSIAFISDLHMDGPLGGNAYGRSRLRRMVSELNSNSAVVGVVVGGDFVTAGYANTERDETAILELSARIRRAQITVPATPEAHAAVTAAITAIKHAGRRAPLTPELLDQVAHDLIGGNAPAP